VATRRTRPDGLGAPTHARPAIYLACCAARPPRDSNTRRLRSVPRYARLERWQNGVASARREFDSRTPRERANFVTRRRMFHARTPNVERSTRAAHVSLDLLSFRQNRFTTARGTCHYTSGTFIFYKNNL